MSKSEWPKTLKSLNQRKKLFDFYDFKAPAWNPYPKTLPLYDKTPNSKVQPVNGLRQRILVPQPQVTIFTLIILLGKL